MKHKAEPSIACLREPPAEQILVVAAKNGDEHAFETLFKRHQQRVLRVVMRYTRVREDAEDVVQQSFHKAFVHLCRFEGKSSFSTWLTRIAINEALMFLRSISTTRKLSIGVGDAEASAASLEIPDSRQDPEAGCLQRERTRILLSALKNLRPHMRQALELRELAELSTEQTAQKMGLSVGAVKARIFHGKRKLRERLRRYVKPSRSGARALDMCRPGGHIPPRHLSAASGL
jgi:RNA polymerase sigma-70 factor, ECF subfamily